METTIYFDIENHINDRSFLSNLESSFYSYRNSSYYLTDKHTSEDPYDNHDTQCSWNNHINSCIDDYLQSQICIEASIVSGSNNYSYIYRSVCGVKVEMVV